MRTAWKMAFQSFHGFRLRETRKTVFAQLGMGMEAMHQGKPRTFAGGQSP